MPGNVPNVSRDSFDIAKRYDKVSLQQGVPIPDSDWNELHDIERMARILLNMKGWGNIILPADPSLPSATPGYSFSKLGGIEDGDCVIHGGWAFVDGVLTSTTVADPAGDITFEDDTHNIMGEGTVEIFAADVLTDTSKNWQAFHDLVAVGASHTGCRVKFTSGAESGNEFVITAFTATTLTIPGAAPSAADTYIVKPPAVDESGLSGGEFTSYRAFLMVWFEDISDDEDSSIQHPGLGVETAHRDKMRSVVRIHGLGFLPPPAAPTTPSKHSFGVRYLALGLVGGEYGAQGLGDTQVLTAREQGDYANRFPLDSTDLQLATFPDSAQAWSTGLWGGVQFTAPGDLEAFAQAVEYALKRQLNYATIGDPASILHRMATDNGSGINPSVGSYFAKLNGLVADGYTVPDAATGDGVVIGEARDTTFFKPGATRAKIHGRWERVTFDNDSVAGNRYFMGGQGDPVDLDDCRIGAGVFEMSPDDDYKINRLRKCVVDFIGTDTDLPGDAGLRIGMGGPGSFVVVEDSVFSVSVTEALVSLHERSNGAIDTDYGATVVFRNCIFRTATDVELFRNDENTNDYVVYMDGCLFERTVTSDKWAIDLNLNASAGLRVGFRDCRVITIGGLGVRIAGTGHIDNFDITVNGPVNAGVPNPIWLKATNSIIGTGDHATAKGLRLDNVAVGGTAVRASAMTLQERLVQITGYTGFTNLAILVTGAFPHKGILELVGPANAEGRAAPVREGLVIDWDTGPTTVGTALDGVIHAASTPLPVRDVSLRGTNSGVTVDGRVMINGGIWHDLTIWRRAGDAETDEWVSALINGTIVNGIIRSEDSTAGFDFTGIVFDQVSMRGFRLLAQSSGSNRGVESSGGVLVEAPQSDLLLSAHGEGSFIEDCKFLVSGDRSEIIIDLDDGSPSIDTLVNCEGNSILFDGSANIDTVVIREVGNGTPFVHRNLIKGPADGSTDWIDLASSQGQCYRNTLHSSSANAPTIDTAAGDTIITDNILKN